MFVLNSYPLEISEWKLVFGIRFLQVWLLPDLLESEPGSWRTQQARLPIHPNTPVKQISICERPRKEIYSVWLQWKEQQIKMFSDLHKFIFYILTHEVGLLSRRRSSLTHRMLSGSQVSVMGPFPEAWSLSMHRGLLCCHHAVQEWCHYCGEESAWSKLQARKPSSRPSVPHQLKNSTAESKVSL